MKNSVIQLSFLSCCCLLLAMTTKPVEGAGANLPDMWFDTLDVDHDGKLDKSEYDLGLQKITSFLKQPLALPENGSSSSSSGFSLDAWFAVPSESLSLLGFWKAFTSAFAMILATEIGDKTFFIAAILSMKHDRAAVFAGAITALVVMTFLSTAMGLVLPRFIPRQYTHWIGGILFLYFGIKLMLESTKMQAGKASEELEEVEEELLKQSNKKEEDEEEGLQRSNSSLSTAGGRKVQKLWYHVFLQSLTLTFLAEWGDRSQIATIALAAAKNPVGVTVGGCLGHSVCTGLAVLGGRILASRISEKTVSWWGGVVFIVCGMHSIFLEE